LQVGDLFLAWSKKFGKTYSQDQQSEKLATFKYNANLINSHNAQYEKGLQSYTMALNQFSDLSDDEFKAVHLSEYKPTRDRKETVLDTSNVADSVDWRTKGAVTPIKDQGLCGSDWAFSTTGSLEGRWQIAGNNLTALSAQQLMDCSGPEGDESCLDGLEDWAFQYILDNKGIGTEAGYPFKGMNEKCNAVKEKQIVASIKGFTHTPKGNEAQLEAAIAQGPVSASVEAFDSGFKNYHSGNFSGKCGEFLDHAVVVVGYTKYYWIVKNSWGTTWGEAGYMRMSRAGNLCGIQNEALYPIVEGGTPSPPVSDKYTTIEQKVFHGIGGCATPNPAVTPIPVGKCEPDNAGGAFIMSCSADGSSFTQTQYSDATCNTKTQALPGQTGKCYKQSQLQYLEFTCKTADHYEIAQN